MPANSKVDIKTTTEEGNKISLAINKKAMAH